MADFSVARVLLYLGIGLAVIAVIVLLVRVIFNKNEKGFKDKKTTEVITNNMTNEEVTKKMTKEEGANYMTNEERAKFLKDLIKSLVWCGAAIIILATTVPLIYMPWLSGEVDFAFMENVVIPAVLYGLLMYSIMSKMLKKFLGNMTRGQSGSNKLLALFFGIVIALILGAFIGPILAVIFLVKRLIEIFGVLKLLRATAENDDGNEEA